jgi:hypothetical protein
MKMKQQTLAMANGFERYTKPNHRAAAMLPFLIVCPGRSARHFPLSTTHGLHLLLRIGSSTISQHNRKGELLCQAYMK